MKRLLLIVGAVICFIAVIAQCNSGQAQGPSAPVRTIETIDVEIDYQMKLNSLACKSVGQDDGGQVCDAAKFLNKKLLEAKQPKPAPSAEEKKP